MGNLLNEFDRKELSNRLARLTPDAKPLWGKMTPGHLLAHLIDLFEVTFAERPVTVRKGLMNSAFGRWMLSTMPLPKNAKTDPEYLKRPVGNFEQDKAKVQDYIQRFAAPEKFTFGASPWVGQMTPEQWAKSHYTHLAHHLKQFNL